MRKFEAVISCGISLVFLAEDDETAKKIAGAHAKKGERIDLFNGKSEGENKIWVKENGKWSMV